MSEKIFPESNPQTNELPQMSMTDEWSQDTFYRRNKHGMSLEVNKLYASVDSPLDPEFPDAVGMNRSHHGLESNENHESKIGDVAASTLTAIGSVAMSREVNKERPYDRYDQIFNPLRRPEVTEEQIKALGPAPQNRYDYLFESDAAKADALYQEHAAYDTRKALLYKDQKKYDRLVTDESMREGRDKLIQVVQYKPGLAKIFTDHGVDPLHDQTASERLRTDPELRRNVGIYLLEEINRYSQSADAPDRIRRNTSKNPDTQLLGGVQRMTSREYSAFLALSMLDGTFNVKKSENDPMGFGPTGDVRQGQHRAAAYAIL